MIELSDGEGGVVLRVRARPGAKKAGVLGEHDGALRVAVTAPPEGGRANAALEEALAEALGVKRWQVELLSGHVTRDKRFLVRGVGREELAAKLAGLMG